MGRCDAIVVRRISPTEYSLGRGYANRKVIVITEGRNKYTGKWEKRKQCVYTNDEGNFTIYLSPLLIIKKVILITKICGRIQKFIFIC